MLVADKQLDTSKVADYSIPRGARRQLVEKFRPRWSEGPCTDLLLWLPDGRRIVIASRPQVVIDGVGDITFATLPTSISFFFYIFHFDTSV